MINLASDAVQVTIDPVRGGKLLSLLDRRSGREWLVPPGDPEGGAAGYGASFVAADMCGWDEMVPTIVACELPTPSGPISLPDHGEVWSVPWRVTRSDPQALTAAVEGTAIPYRFERTVRLLEPDVLRLSYHLETPSPVALPILWAAHPQLRWQPGCRVELPSGIDRVLDVTADPAREVAWDPDLAGLLDAAEDGRGHKVWCLPQDRPGTAALRDADGGALRMAWDPVEVPYLGVWFDAEAYAPERTVALEPATGFYDDLAAAAGRGLVRTLRRGAPLRWTLDLRLDPPRKPFTLE
jgi:galactose mutarotase-like enzyme